MTLDIQELIRTVLTVLVFPFLVRWLIERKKGDLARRIALIASDIAGSVYAMYPTWDEAKLIQQIIEQLAAQFPSLPSKVVNRVATAALATAKLPAAVKLSQQSK